MLFELIPRLAIATFVVLFSTNHLAPAAYAAEGAPDRLRNIQFGVSHRFSGNRFSGSQARSLDSVTARRRMAAGRSAFD